jgi:uncharacterized protein YhbP (UPF0306 family)
MNESITCFIEKQKCATVCCVDEKGQPYCFSCFYAFNAEEGVLYFKSSDRTNHIKLMKENPVIAGTILPDKLQMLVVKGIQFQGVFLLQQHEFTKDGSKHYHSKYPFALAVPGEVWTIRLTHIKMTDSSKGFGNKIDWIRAETPAA